MPKCFAVLDSVIKFVINSAIRTPLDIIRPKSIKASLAGSQKDLFPTLPPVGLSQEEVL